jgi:hypothetical protein
MKRDVAIKRGRYKSEEYCSIERRGLQNIKNSEEKRSLQEGVFQ